MLSFILDDDTQYIVNGTYVSATNIECTSPKVNDAGDYYIEISEDGENYSNDNVVFNYKGMKLLFFLFSFFFIYYYYFNILLFRRRNTRGSGSDNRHNCFSCSFLPHFHWRWSLCLEKEETEETYTRNTRC